MPPAPHPPPVTLSPTAGSSPSALPLPLRSSGRPGHRSSVCCKQLELLATQTPTNPASMPPRPEPTPPLTEPLLSDCPWRLHSSPGATSGFRIHLLCGHQCAPCTAQTPHSPSPPLLLLLPPLPSCLPNFFPTSAFSVASEGYLRQTNLKENNK